VFEPTFLGETTSCRVGVGQDVPFFPEGCSYLGVFSGLFLGDGLVIALLGCFRSLCIPLGTSVEYGVSGNRRLGFRIRGDNGVIHGDSLTVSTGFVGRFSGSFLAVSRLEREHYRDA